MRNHRILNSLVTGGALMAMLATVSLATAMHPHFTITQAKANTIVLKRFAHGVIVGKTKLENEEGTWQYGVMVRKGKLLREVMVNAKTGHIDRVEVTNAAKENGEALVDAAQAKKGHQHTPVVKSTK